MKHLEKQESAVSRETGELKQLLTVLDRDGAALWTVPL